MPEVQRATRLVREAGYVAVGLGVLGLQRAAVRRRELQQRVAAEPRLDAALGGLRTEAARRANDVDRAVERTIEQIESAMEPIEHLLPTRARAVLGEAHVQARELRGVVRSRLSALTGTPDRP